MYRRLASSGANTLTPWPSFTLGVITVVTSAPVPLSVSQRIRRGRDFLPRSCQGAESPLLAGYSRPHFPSKILPPSTCKRGCGMSRYATSGDRSHSEVKSRKDHPRVLC